MLIDLQRIGNRSKFGPRKPVSLRHIERKGKSKEGKWKDPSNNAEAFSVIE
jgi:hypothetical protein